MTRIRLRSLCIYSIVYSLFARFFSMSGQEIRERERRKKNNVILFFLLFHHSGHSIVNLWFFFCFRSLSSIYYYLIFFSLSLSLSFSFSSINHRLSLRSFSFFRWSIGIVVALFGYQHALFCNSQVIIDERLSL